MPEKKPLTVLNVVIEDRIAGPQLRVLHVAKKLESQGIRTVVIISTGGGGYAQLLRDNGVPFYELYSLRRVRAKLNPWFHISWLFWFVRCVFVLMRVAKAEKADIFHFNNAF
jgi:hypothetical protein